MSKTAKRLCAYLSLLTILSNIFLTGIPGITILAKETRENGTFYGEGENWCEGSVAKICTGGLVESSPCNACNETNGTCDYPLEPPAIASCGHLGQSCCRGETKCYEGKSKRQGFLGLFGCKCVFEDYGTLYDGAGCSFAGQKICLNNTVYLCALEGGQFVKHFLPCAYGTCMDNQNCAEEPVLSPTPTPLSTPNYPSVTCPTQGEKRCGPDNLSIQECGANLLWTFREPCPGGCDPNTISCVTQCASCDPPGKNYCTISSLVTCSTAGCIGNVEPCEFGCLDDTSTGSRCKTAKEIFTVMPGQPYHFNDPVLRWSPILGMLTRLFYEGFAEAVHTNSGGIAITMQTTITDVNKYLMLDEAYRQAVNSAPTALFLLAAFATLSPYYSPIAIKNLQEPLNFPPNVIHSSRITPQQFVSKANPRLVKEIKFIAKENPNIRIVLESHEYFDEKFKAFPMKYYTGYTGMTWNSGYGVAGYSEPIPPKTDYFLISEIAPPGIPAHELGHIITNITGKSESIPMELFKRLGLNNPPFKEFKEYYATAEGQRWLVEHGMPIPPESTAYLQRRQNELMQELAKVMGF